MRAAVLRRESALREFATGLKAGRGITPRLVYARQGEPDARWFKGWLIDDLGTGGGESSGYAAFVQEHCKAG